MWKHFHDPCHGFDQIFRFDWFTPYLFGYALVRAFAGLFSVGVAFRIALYGAVIALPLAIRFLLSRTSADVWLSLLGFPLAFGFTFYWGFINYVIAIPIAVLFLALLWDLALRPGVARATAVAALATCLLISHGLIFFFAAVSSIALAAFVRPRRRAWVIVAPLMVPIALLLLWAARMRGNEAPPPVLFRWHLSIDRLWHFPSTLLSNETDPLAVAAFAVAIVAVIALGIRLPQDRRRIVYLAVAAIGYCVAPQAAFGRAFLFERFAVFVAIAAMFAIDLPSQATWPRLVITCLSIAWALVLMTRFQRFGNESAEFETIAAAIPTDRRVAYYIADVRSEAAPGAVYLHFPAYYQVERAGVVARSFAAHAPQLIRYRPGQEPSLGGSVLFNPRSIDWKGLATFDCVIVRAAADPTRALAMVAPYPLMPLVHTRTWWLYQTPYGRRPGSGCPPL